MRILIIANNAVGLYQFRKELIEELLKDNTVLISLPYGELVKPLRKLGCKYINTPIDRRGVNPVTDLQLLLRYWDVMKKVKPDLVISYTIKPNVYGGFVCRMQKIPYAVNITGLGKAFQEEGLVKKLVVMMYKVSTKKAKTVFFENAEDRQTFIEEGFVKAEKALLLSGAGVNLEHYHVTEYPTGEVTRFLFIGRVMKEKGMNELFAAMRQLRADGITCTLDVLGHYEEDYKAVIAQYESEGWLHYYGYQRDVRPFIEAAHCFVLPSWHEGMANTNLECAASGRPVITSNIHGCLEAVEDGASGFLCESKNADSLYQTMRKFTKLSYEERKAMGLAGRRRMEELFDKKDVIRRTMKGL